MVTLTSKPVIIGINGTKSLHCGECVSCWAVEHIDGLVRYTEVSAYTIISVEEACTEVGCV